MIGPAARSRSLVVLLALCALVLVVRLAWLQLHEQEVWAERRESNLKGFQWVPGMRGSILDRNGQVLAKDVPQFTLELRYREFRREHSVALLVNLDRFVRMLDENPAIPAPPSPGGSARLRYQDFGARFGIALERVAQWPARWLHKRGPLRGLLRSTMRFYVMELVRLAIDPRRSEFPSQTRLGLRLDAMAESPSDAPIFDELAFVFGRQRGPAGGRALFQEVYAGVDAAWRQLQEFEERLGPELLLRHEQRARGSLTAFLDSLYFVHERLARQLLADFERRRCAREDERFRGLREFLGLFEAAQPRTEFSLEERLEWRWRAEDRPLIVASPIDFERTAAWLGVRAGRFPGFQVGETVHRQHPVRPEDRARYAFVGRVGTNWAKLASEDLLQSPESVKERLGVNASQWERLEPWFEQFRRHVRLSAEREGLTGVERSLQRELVGSGGLRDLMRDRRGRELTSESYAEATRGPDVQLSIDVRLQDLAFAALRRFYESDEIGPPARLPWLQRSAGFAVIDVHSGDVLAIASLPLERRHEVTGEWVPVARNYATSFGYRPIPGSVLKPFLAAYAMRYGQDFDMDFAGCRESGHLYRCQDHPALLHCHPHVEASARSQLELALAYSCNVYFGQLAQALGWEGYQDMLALFDLAIPEKGPRERYAPRGLVVHRPRTVRAVSLAHGAIGYGIHVAPLNLARAYAGLATGRLPGLRFVQSIGTEVVPGAPAKELGIDPRGLRRVQEGLRLVTLRGTARDTFRLGFDVAGKTGTPEIVLGDDVERYRNNAVFCGFAPFRQPRLAFAVRFDAVPDKAFQGSRAARVVQRFLATVEANPELRQRYLRPR